MLVAIMNSTVDWAIVREELWYRIPVAKAPKRWPPRWIAFYQTKVFGKEAHKINYFARVKEIRQVKRRELFPGGHLIKDPDSDYFQLILENIELLPQPIPSLRLRRIVFIPTTLTKLELAQEINDLYDESPLEDALWTAMKRLKLPAERQFYIEHERRWYFLDFAVSARRAR